MNVGSYPTSSGVRTWHMLAKVITVIFAALHMLAKVITVIFAASRSVHYMVYLPRPCSHRCVVKVILASVMLVHVLFSI